MQIVKDGEVGNPDKWKAEVTCEKKDKFDTNGCSAVLSIILKDMIMMYFEGTHFRHYYTAIKCPRCGKYNRVKDVPVPVLKKFGYDTARRRKSAIFDGFSESIY